MMISDNQMVATAATSLTSLLSFQTHSLPSPTRKTRQTMTLITRTWTEGTIQICSLPSDSQMVEEALTTSQTIIALRELQASSLRGWTTRWWPPSISRDREVPTREAKRALALLPQQSMAIVSTSKSSLAIPSRPCSTSKEEVPVAAPCLSDWLYST